MQSVPGDFTTGVPVPRTRPWRMLGVLGWLSTPVLGAELAAGTIQPPFYAAIFGTLLSMMVLGSARRLLPPALRCRPPAAPPAAGVPAPELREIARLISDVSDTEAVTSGVARALALSLAVEPEAIVVRLGAHSADGDVAAGLVVADAAARYDDAPSLPLVAESTELGRVLLPGRPAVGGDSEERAALSAVLCAVLALHLRGRQYREGMRACERQLESLRRRLESEATAVRTPVRRAEGFPEVIGQSEALLRTLALVERTAPSEVSILVTGETGTGKELVARAVHARSPRRDGPLVTVNCPAIPGPLAESELFGHERGAFTDAVAARAGQFELAHGGTIFLDEVADLPLDIQAKLLRVLQEGEVRRVGGHRARPVDVRTVAATNRDLRALVREGRFREDLYYRLAAVEVVMPPLRARHGDVPILASHFLEQAVHTAGGGPSGFTAEALAALCRYTWPGNVRELQNVVRRAALLCGGDAVQAADLVGVGDDRDGGTPRFGESIRQEKRRRFLEALHHTGWNQSAAARLLGMSRSNFARMVRSLGIAVPPRGERGRGAPHQ